MAKENKFLNKKTAIVSAGLVAAYLLYKQANSAKDGLPEGSLGGEDELEGQQGFDIDPNSPIPSEYNPNETFFFVSPEGQIQASPTATAPDGNSPTSGTPTYSSGSGSLVTDAAVLGGALGFNALLPNLGKGIKGAIDSKYAYRATGDVAAESNFMKWLKDPYNVGESKASKILREGSSEIVGAADRPILKEGGQQIIQTVPKWAKGVKGVANFIPLLDIPIGAGLDVYFSKYETDPNKKIDWWTALQANTAGELAQLGVTGAAAAAGTVVPVVGNIAGGVGGFIVGTGADIAATEAVYKAKGKSSLFDFGSSSTPAQISQMTPAQQSAQASLFSTLGISSVNPFQNMSVANQSSSSGGGGSSQVYYTDKGVFTSLAAANAAGSTMSVAPQSSGGGGGSSSSSRASTSSNVSASSSSKSSSSVSASKAPQTSSSVASKVGSVASAAKSAASSTVSKVTSAAKSVASKVKSIFKRRK